MNKTLDSFESALLLELRRHVAEHPAPAPVPLRRPRRRLRIAAIAATGVAASVAAVLGLGGTGSSPAYAVDRNSDGDVIITVHRLDDAAGLEQALRAKGIDADVSYDAHGSAGTFSVDDPAPGEGQAPNGEGGLTAPVGGDGPSHVGTGGEASGGEPATSGPGSAESACGPVEPPPATLAHDDGDWVLTIPAGSALQDRHVDIRTDSSGALSVTYAADIPGGYCGVTSMGSPGTP